MSDALTQVENQVLSFSLAEQIRLLTFIANNVNKQTSILAEGEALKKIRESSLETVWESIKNDSW
ncbi:MULTISPECIES: hypothetical protein [Treponema]|jgi:hypothetical protein|uniref:Uncharacterized protein n=2 Tax=Treponema denticola TaxID=158 RepID=Q73K02_TREDE|nr:MULTISPECIES: hypothetical protein [Treponema]AAS13080.1 hypothetical protein TDE_2563 [Treponema denticola ATCC 35405]EMB30944.1 hypothetical protein HMPREF9727_00629 [Treponema denticola MYR-T]EMB31873.1 hypothetical protein HMPREF9725_00995 [Treponema denticola H1-T]EMB37969.1 hypothetical protein HMPREF9721_01218 [Treponema denticola ATCC 35404]EMB39948.1 hypothetical protein HMPREF9735_00612 [Treponema denticola ATCC 33521]